MVWFKVGIMVQHRGALGVVLGEVIYIVGVR